MGFCPILQIQIMQIGYLLGVQEVIPHTKFIQAFCAIMIYEIVRQTQYIDLWLAI